MWQMSNYKVWCWEAAQNKRGPDWGFVARVTLESQEELERLATETTLDQYTYYVEEKDCDHHRQRCRHHVFVDTSSQNAYRSKRNMWVYNLVQIHAGVIEIECGYGGRGKKHNHIETSFLLKTLASAKITLGSWKVVVGGNFYDFETLSEGVNLSDLKNYLT